MIEVVFFYMVDLGWRRFCRFECVVFEVVLIFFMVFIIVVKGEISGGACLGL